MKLGNLTLRMQTGSARSFFLARGYDVEREPHGIVIRDGETATSVHRRAAQEIAAASARACTGVLLGGQVEVGIALYVAAQQLALACFTLLVKREADAGGGFRYELKEVRRLADAG